MKLRLIKTVNAGKRCSFKWICRGAMRLNLANQQETVTAQTGCQNGAASAHHWTQTAARGAPLRCMSGQRSCLSWQQPCVPACSRRSLERLPQEPRCSSFSPGPCWPPASALVRKKLHRHNCLLGEKLIVHLARDRAEWLSCAPFSGLLLPAGHIKAHSPV